MIVLNLNADCTHVTYYLVQIVQNHRVTYINTMKAELKKSEDDLDNR
jgi:hypothetical protein